MQKLLQSVGLTFLLLASAGAAFAMDQSAIEETNCLMACDANQQNCQSSGTASGRQNHSRAAFVSPREIKSSLASMRAQPSKER